VEVAHDRGAAHGLADDPFGAAADLDRGGRWGAQPLLQELGRRIARHRLDRNLSQAQLAE
jgi:hypothetical protein